MDIGCAADGLRGPNEAWFKHISDPVALKKIAAKGTRLIADNDSKLPILAYACQIAPVESIRILLEAGGADFINVSDDCGVPPLIYAAERRDIKIIKTLIEFGADINVRGDRDDETVLTAIVERVELKVIRDLVTLGADPTLTGSAGISAVRLAERRFKKNPNEENRILLDLLRSVRPRPH